MKVSLELIGNMKFVGRNSDNLETNFGTHAELGGDDSAATPMEIMLEALAACSSMDIVSILRKKRKTIEKFDVFIDGERRDTHPKTFVKVHLKYVLKSPDAEIGDLERAVTLSQTTYCGAAELFRKSGCELTYEMELIK